MKKIWVVFGLLLSSMAMAGDKVETDDGYVEASRWQLALAFGAGQSSSPLVGGKSMPLLIMPDVSYYGRLLFFDNGILGAGLDVSPNWSISLVSRLNPEKGYFYRWHLSRLPSFNPMVADTPTVMQDSRADREFVSVQEVQRRPTAWDGGVQFNAWFDNWMLRLNAWTDISGQHHGHELRAAMGYHFPSAVGDWRLGTALSWKSEQLMQTYYGLGANEASYLPRYQASASWQPEVELHWSLPVRAGWRIMAFYRFRWLDSAMTQSPLVQDSSQHSWFIGWSYRFL